jgi:lipoprotein signal peptidase
VIYTGQNPQLSAKISYKDFDNNDQTKTLSFPIKVYTQEQAKSLGLVSQSRTGTYIIGIIIIIIIWYFWRRVRKKKKLNKETGKR